MIRYAITDPAYYSGHPNTLKERTKKVLTLQTPDWIVLRDKQSRNYPRLATSFLSLKIEFPQVKFFLHADLDLAVSLGAEGVHLTSGQIADVARAKRMGLFVVVSTHTLGEALEAQRLGADAVTFSPVFASPGKGEPVGLEKLKEIRDKISIKVIALGGIVTDAEIDAVMQTGVDGFASIRRFVS